MFSDELEDIKNKIKIEAKRQYIIKFINNISNFEKAPKDTNYINQSVGYSYFAMYMHKEELIKKVMFEKDETILDNIIDDINNDETMKQFKIKEI